MYICVCLCFCLSRSGVELYLLKKNLCEAIPNSVIRVLRVCVSVFAVLDITECVARALTSVTSCTVWPNVCAPQLVVFV